MLVYVLFHETNDGEGIGYVEAIFANEALANAARLAAIRGARDAGQAIFFDPDTGEDFPDDWEHDWLVQAHQLQELVPTAACPRCGETSIAEPGAKAPCCHNAVLVAAQTAEPAKAEA